METCGVIPPRQDEMVVLLGKDQYLAECILPIGHLGPHVIKTPEGEFYAWEDDMECGCCEPDEEDRCYTYWSINESDIPKLAEG